MAPKRKVPSTEVDISGPTSTRPKRSPKAPVEVAAEPKRYRPTFKVELVVDSEKDPSWVLDEPIADSEARTTWPERYQVIQKKEVVPLPKKKKKKYVEEEEIFLARRHFRRAILDESITYNLFDDAHVQSDEDEKPFICKIVEIFEGSDGKMYFTAQWFYRACDTAIQKHEEMIDDKRVFISDIKDVNSMGVLLNKLKILMIPLTENTEVTESCDYYCNMKYRLPFSTLEALQSSQCITPNQRTDATMLDLYCGCGAMSTGLCMGAQLSGLNLVTKWAVDTSKYAVQSIKYNHPETEVRNESAEDFLYLLKEWEKLCIHFSLIESADSEKYENLYGMSAVEEVEDGSDESDVKDGGEVFEVEKIVGIKKEEGGGLHLKVRWENYGPSHDTWEPIENLSNCRKKIKEFVVHGFKTSILPLPGGVDVVCGGPPCQGISGYNRFRNTKEPLKDKKNEQLLEYMKIVEFLKPKYVLMENVVDMLRFVDGFLARYAVGRLVQMNYQTRMGMMAAGSYGLAQFRRRFFLWGAMSSERLPQFPLPTHDVVNRGNVPVNFDRNVVAYEQKDTVKLAKKILLSDVITDLPVVANSERRAEMAYVKDPQTPFQRFIRSTQQGMFASPQDSKSNSTNDVLYDHHPLNLNKDDYQRVCRIPKKKGANFRDLPGVTVNGYNRVELDPKIPRIYLESSNPLIPEYAIKFVNGRSTKPFGRLWWDETVPTVIGRAEPHNHVIIHPSQDRVLTVRENARLQGFPDYYRLFGPTKEKYKQVGNAVAVPVASALGFALGQAFQGHTSGNDPLFTLPEGFPKPTF
ncbi:PREDICTED: DNA (cytosine-5)-methyltransferase CMT3 [Brassica oleracea var. oleracea]|uniref:Cytosine-specific methyltransferase n=1 Tax=Brassica oleracea var. oleracea TaxID=109376 RepID=A0A0D3BEY1_BRAOL|nr:PREDICTED: DNA (cytosine-5)-methyltransferase CMT3 [Brassica oleracea var. oleracea]